MDIEFVTSVKKLPQEKWFMDIFDKQYFSNFETQISNVKPKIGILKPSPKPATRYRVDAGGSGGLALQQISVMINLSGYFEAILGRTNVHHAEKHERL